MKTLRSVVLAGVAAAACPLVAGAQGVNLGQATLEEPMDVRVTSAARKSQRAEDVPAAIYVISQRDIARSGLMTLPDSVYTRSFSGVFWDLLDVMVSVIERIEIIRGPGGAVWGANAVNGVINI